MIDTVKQPLSELETLRQENDRLRQAMKDALKHIDSAWSKEDAAVVVKDFRFLTETMNFIEATLQGELDFGGDER